MLPRRSQYKVPLAQQQQQQQTVLRKNMQLPLQQQQQQQYSYWSPPPPPPSRTSIPMPTSPSSPIYDSPIVNNTSGGTPRKWVGVGNHHNQHRQLNNRQQRHSSNIMVEHPNRQQQQQQQQRPRMGVTRTNAPIMTSTPQQQQQQQQQQHRPPKTSAPIAEEEEEEEPIYCEISRSGDNSASNSPLRASETNNSNKKNPPPPLKANLNPTTSNPPFASVQRRGGSGRRRERQSRRLAGDFSQITLNENNNVQERSKKDMLLMRRNNEQPSSNNRKSCDLSNKVDEALYYRPAPGLGRRAATQVDMMVSARQAQYQRQQQYHHQHHVSQQRRMYHQHVSASNRNLFHSDTESVQSHPVRMNRQQQHVSKQRDELYSDYGFGSGLDDTASSVATTSTATTTTTNNNITSNVIRKGLLWQQRSGLFSRWKERYLVLTPDYLNCFRRGGAGLRSEMGAFAFKVRLAEVEGVEVVDRRGYLTVVLTVKGAEGGEGGGGQGKILLRKPEGIREWYNDIKDCVQRCKERRGHMKSTKEFWSRKQFTDSSSMEQWLLARKRIESKYAYNSDADTCSSNPNGMFPLPLPPPAPLNHRELSRSNANVFQLQTTDYGFIDSPDVTRRHRQQQQQKQQPIIPAPIARGDRVPSRSDVFSDCSIAPSSSSAGMEGRSSVSPTSDVMFGAPNLRSTAGMLSRDTSSTFSHDSGVDSMNTNSSGSVLSRQTPTSYATTVLPPREPQQQQQQQRQQQQQQSSSKTPTKSHRPSKIPTLARQRPVLKNKAVTPVKQNVYQHQHVSLV